MKALDIMEAAGGIDDEILMEVTSAMQEKNTGKPLRAKRTLRTVLIAAALVLVLAGSALAAGRLINSPAQAVRVAMRTSGMVLFMRLPPFREKSEGCKKRV